MEFITKVFTNVGGRNNNEDFAGYVYKPGEYGVWIVADGLGGHHGGERASNLAVNMALSAYERNPVISEKNIENVLTLANQIVLSEQAADRKFSDMRTTIVGLFTNGREALWAHVGDSRLYGFRNGRLVSQTKDHSVSQMAVSSGEISQDQIRFHEDRNRLLRVLGTGPELRAEVHKPVEVLVPGDAFLLCTDGFWEYVHEVEMEVDLAKSVTPEQWVELMAGRLYKRVNGENDNFTAIAVFVE